MYVVLCGRMALVPKDGDDACLGRMASGSFCFNLNGSETGGGCASLMVVNLNMASLAERLRPTGRDPAWVYGGVSFMAP